MALIVMLSVLCGLPVALLAAPCQVKPADVISDISTAWSAEPVPGSKITPLVTKEFNGVTGSNYAHVSMAANSYVPPHRHPGAEEYVFVTKGTAWFTYWLPGAKEKVTAEAKAGSFHYLPPGGMHDVTTKGEAAEFTVTTTPSGFQVELFSEWPESLDGEVKGMTVGLLDPMGCPPGQEAKDEL